MITYLLRMVRKIGFIILVSPVCLFLIKLCFLLREFPARLPPEVQRGEPCDLMEDTGSNGIVKSLFRNIQFRMPGKDLVRGLALPEQWNDNGGHRGSFLYSEVYTLAGVHQGSAVIHLCVLRAVVELIEPTMGTVGTAVAGAERVVTSGAVEGAYSGESVVWWCPKAHLQQWLHSSGILHLWVSTRWSLIFWPMVDLFFLMACAMAVLVEPFVIPVRMILCSSSVKWENAFVFFV